MKMRRLLTLATFLLLIASVPVYAQRGGHGGFGGGHAASGGHSFGGGRFGGSHASMGHVGSYAGSHFGSHLGAGTRGFGDHFRGRSGGTRFSFRTRGYGYGYPYYPYYGFYDPYWDSWWWDSGSSYDDDDAGERQAASQMNEENLEEQRMLAQEERDGDQDVYARNTPVHARAAKQDNAPSDPPTVLVFRDQHQREIQNYAITDGILWNFTGSRVEKIPLATLDIPATVKVNDDHGVDFHLPGTGEGQ